MSRHATNGGALLAVFAGLAEWLSRHGLSDVTVICAVIGAACALAGLAVNTWTRLPEMHRTWGWLRGKPVPPIEHED